MDMSVRVTAIDVVDDDKDVLYIGIASGGLWKVANGGTTFQSLLVTTSDTHAPVKNSAFSNNMRHIVADNCSFVDLQRGQS